MLLHHFFFLKRKTFIEKFLLMCLLRFLLCNLYLFNRWCVCIYTYVYMIACISVYFDVPVCLTMYAFVSDVLCICKKLDTKKKLNFQCGYLRNISGFYLISTFLKTRVDIYVHYRGYIFSSSWCTGSARRVSASDNIHCIKDKRAFVLSR